MRAWYHLPVILGMLLALLQAGNEIVISVSDDGGGLDYPRIRSEAVKRGLLAA